MILTRANNQSVKHTRNKAADITHLEHVIVYLHQFKHLAFCLCFIELLLLSHYIVGNHYKSQ